MKKLFLLALFILTVAIPSNLCSQSEKTASKVAMRDAKRYAKEGWKVKDGASPIAKQLDRYYYMSYEYVESSEGLVPKYLFGESGCVDETYDAAKKDAILKCRIIIAEIAEMIREEAKTEEIIIMDTVSVTTVFSLDNDRFVSTKTITGIDSEGREVATLEVVTKTAASEDFVSTTVILPRLEDVIPVREFYRDLPGGEVEVFISMAYEPTIQNKSKQ